MHQFRSLTHVARRLKRFNAAEHATLSETDGRHQPKVGTRRSQRGNFSPIPSPLLHRCNTFRAFEGESRRRVRSSLEFHITPAQDHFRKKYSGKQTG
ncbi:hypothetical protein [Bradyrhizobium sp. AC87j1]|uniref:hypothetical protein n=1 Tax=Bradyrhizobium sp. AC87j1 TaxID=2055894 RepID=UPI0011AFE218|nr:hypothetical protein [Bradyrhizobium sp. AC87j1]